MSNLDHYLRIHLTGSAGGIELFSRGQKFHDPATTSILEGIRGELVQERTQLLAMADRLGARPAPLAAVAAAVGERIGRLKPNGNPLRRTPLTDLIDLEAMRVALSGKTAGWEALLAVVDRHDGLRREEIAGLHEQALRQLDQVSTLHAAAAAKALKR